MPNRRRLVETAVRWGSCNLATGRGGEGESGGVFRRQGRMHARKKFERYHYSPNSTEDETGPAPPSADDDDDGANDDAAFPPTTRSIALDTSSDLPDPLERR